MPPETRRWIAFFLFTLAVLLIFNVRMAKHQQEVAKARQEAETKARQEMLATSETLTNLGERPTTPTREAQVRAPQTPEEAAAPPPVVDRETGPKAEIHTNTFHVVFSLIGGVPIRWELLNIRTGVPTGEDESASRTLDLIPGVVSRQREYPLTLEGRPFEPFNDAPFAAQTRQIPGGGTELVLTSPELKGLQVVKTLEFPPDGYLVKARVTIRNHSDLRKLFSDNDVGLGFGWQGGFMPPEEDTRVNGTLYALVSNQSGLHSERAKIDQEPSLFKGPIHWAGLERKFFLAALAPAKNSIASGAVVTVRERDVTDEYRQKGIAAPVSVILQHDRFELEPQQEKSFDYSLFAGPKRYGLLQAADAAAGLPSGAGLSVTLFHGYWGIIRWLALILLYLLKWFHAVARNYGVAIILLTILVRLVTYPLTHKSMKIQAKTMAQQAKLKPFIDEINRKYKDNPAQKNQAMMKLWKEHGVNPFGMLRGCVPMLFQMPVFIALYVLLDQAIELRGQSFLWISDLSMPDRLLTFRDLSLPLLGNSLNILPILMGATQVIASKMSMSAAADPTQRQMMIIMPIAFVFFLYTFPSGLMLYWVVTNIWQIGQQKITNRIIQREQAAQSAPARG